MAITNRAYAKATKEATLKINILGLTVSDEDRKNFAERAMAKKSAATRTEIRDFAEKAVINAFEAHGVAISFTRSDKAEKAE